MILAGFAGGRSCRDTCYQGFVGAPALVASGTIFFLEIYLRKIGSGQLSLMIFICFKLFSRGKFLIARNRSIFFLFWVSSCLGKGGSLAMLVHVRLAR